MWDARFAPRSAPTAPSPWRTVRQPLTTVSAWAADGAVVLKVIGIAYLTQFGAQLCADAGEGTVAAKIELAGKILMMTAAAPVLIGLLELVMGLV